MGRQSEGQIGMVTIQDNVLQGYQKGGIVVDNAGSNATIEENSVSGVGPTPIIAQNGIQVSRGAAANVRGNAISGHFYTGCSNQDAAKTGCIPSVSAAVLLFDVQAGAVDHGSNMFRRNQFNLLLITEQSLAPGP